MTKLPLVRRVCHIFSIPSKLYGKLRVPIFIDEGAECEILNSEDQRTTRSYSSVSQVLTR